MERNGHHLWGTFATFFVERVECILDVVVEVGWGAEISWDVEFVVIAICFGQMIAEREKGED